jgi:hypothetical protein
MLALIEHIGQFSPIIGLLSAAPRTRRISVEQQHDSAESSMQEILLRRPFAAAGFTRRSQPGLQRFELSHHCVTARLAGDPTSKTDRSGFRLRSLLRDVPTHTLVP